MKNAVLILILMLFSLPVLPQDSLTHDFKAMLSGSVNKVSNGYVHLLNNSVSYGYDHRKITLNARAGMVFGESLGQVTNRDFNVGSDFNVFLNRERKWYAWGLLNALTSYSLKINHQFQGGVGLAWNVVDNDQFILNLSNGVIYEQSEIIESAGALLNYATVRNSLRVNIRYNFQEDRIRFRTSNFWQPSLSHSSDYIISSQTQLELKLYKWLYITAALQYNTVSSTGKENLLFTYGLTMSHRLYRSTEK